MAPVLQYLADGWFRDNTENEYMVESSEISHALILKYINKSLVIDVNKIDLEKGLVFDMLLKEYKKCIDKYISIFEKSQFNVVGINKSWNEYKKERYSELVTSEKGVDINEVYSIWIFWEKANVYLKKYSPKNYKELKKVQKQCSLEVRNNILEFVTANDRGKYTSLINYIYDRYRDLGILKKSP